MIIKTSKRKYLIKREKKIGIKGEENYKKRKKKPNPEEEVWGVK